MKKLLFFTTILFCLTSYSQVTFEKGYYINNSNKKIDCYIKNVDWKNNPTEIEYRLSENEETKTATIKTIKEFSIYNVSKYVRSNVAIDRSSDLINDLKYNRNPEFVDEELFLKVLVEGKATLYAYRDGLLRRFFYKIENSDIKQLISKRFKTQDNRIGKNNRFKQQLVESLTCNTITVNEVNNVEYSQKSLSKLFVKYNQCMDSGFFIYQQKEKKGEFNLTMRPRFNSSSLSYENSSSGPFDFDFENESGFGFGIEVEFILPYNRGKWAILLEPTYQTYSSQASTQIMTLVFPEDISAQVDYTSIELPIGIRHYFFLNNDSKVFANLSFLYDFSSSSSIEFTRDDGSNFETLEINSGNSLALGFGYKLKEKYSLEFRYFTPRDLIGKELTQSAKYNAFSIILGYSIF